MSLVELLAVLGTVLASVSGMFAMRINQLRDRDKLAFDLRIQTLESKAETAQSERDDALKQMAIIRASEEVCRKETRELHEKYIRADEASKRSEAASEGLRKQTHDLESTVRELLGKKG